MIERKRRMAKKTKLEDKWSGDGKRFRKNLSVLNGKDQGRENG